MFLITSIPYPKATQCIHTYIYYSKEKSLPFANILYLNTTHEEGSVYINVSMFYSFKCTKQKQKTLSLMNHVLNLGIKHTFIK